jgi:flagellar protein FlgJ
MTFLENSNGIRAAVPIADPGENRKSAIQNPAQSTVQQLTGPEYAQAKAEYVAKRDKLQKTTQDFEAVFVGMMLKQMRKSMASQNAILGNSSESKMYQDMMDDATAKHMSQVGTFGLGKLLFKTMASTLPPDPDREQIPGLATKQIPELAIPRLATKRNSDS